MENKNNDIFKDFFEIIKKYYGVIIILFLAVFLISLFINFLIARNIKNKAIKEAKLKKDIKVEKVILAEPILVMDYDKEYLLKSFELNKSYGLDKDLIKKVFVFTDFGNNISFYSFPDYLKRQTLIILFGE